MPVRSILDIAVQQESWDRFRETWNEWEKQLQAQPEVWKKISSIQAKAAGALAQFQATHEAHLSNLKEAQEAGEAQNKELARSASLWGGIEESSKAMAGHVKTATLSMLRWAGLLSGAGAFAGYLSIEGIQRLANEGASQRQQAMGLGASIGQVKAFATNFARIGDIGGLLGFVNQAETDPTSRAYRSWASLGLGVPTGNTATDTLRYLDAVRAFTERTPGQVLGTMAGAFGIPLTAETLRVIQGTGAPEWAQMEAGTRADIARMNVPGAKALQDLSTQLHRNAATVGSALERQLARAAPVLTSFSTAVSNATVKLITFAGNQTASAWERFTTHPLDTLGGFAMDFFSSAAAFDPLGALMGSTPFRWLSQWAAGQGEALGTRASPAVDATAKKALSALERKWFLGLANQIDPSGLLGAVGMLESGMNPFAPTSRAGALGMMQLEPATARALGVNPHDPFASLYGAERLLQQLSAHYHGDVLKTLAAYNWRPGALDNDIKQYGANWFQHSPAETQRYIIKYLQELQRLLPASLKIQIRTAPGGSAIDAIQMQGSRP